ncbi:hypothetical protein mvi_60610 (plasmid) [Methylobacterium indicum]|uniref:Calcineurin-like phosphoesterase domain-containing protein n=2 Tax=Methylobacterium indicum TaxID=1775910 RepID=A0A8H8X031_9HYPH|nr:hypothetical protein mvi_60610 [Methylobacterium indicum]
MIREAGKIVFHAVGDTGASDVRIYREELRVADQMSTDCRTFKIDNKPSFFFHLGDVVYSFGESEHYYTQFYEPFRDYSAPIVAIPGNHDSFLRPGIDVAEAPLTVFARNFCATAPTITPEAGALHRTAATQPGVYFALDAPFVRIIALFSNALEDPGVVSSGGGRWPGVPDHQLSFLRAQLRKVKEEAYAGALLFATHHPPFSYEPPPGQANPPGHHGSSTAMLREIDDICREVGVYPHAWLSAHSHNYQRYTRTVAVGDAVYQVPFVVCGNGGHNVNPLLKDAHGDRVDGPESDIGVNHMDPSAGISRGLHFEKYDDQGYGYLRVAVDAEVLRIAYHQVGDRGLLQSRYDLVTVDLTSHRLAANSNASRAEGPPQRNAATAPSPPAG